MKIDAITPETLSRIVGASSDLALVLDPQGVVVDVSVRKSELLALGCEAWVGRPWIDTVTSESRGKVQELLSPEALAGDLRWRQVNHATAQGVDVPVQYAVMALDTGGQLLVLGRDMEIIAALQRRLVETQQSMEKDYLRLRQTEARYRVLFETSGEAVMLVDGVSLRVTEANASAQAIAKDTTRKLVGRDVLDCFELASRDDLLSLLRMAQATGRIEMCRARFQGAALDCTAAVSAFRQDGGVQYLLRVVPRDSSSGPALPRHQALFSEAMEHAPDGLVLTDRTGQIRFANSEILSMLGATAPSQLHGLPLEGFLVRGGVDWGVLLTHLKAHTVVRGFATELRALAGLAIAVEIAALALVGEETYYAFYIRDVMRRRSADTSLSSGMAGSVAELSRLVGRMPMKDIVGETIDMIEKMCIQSALELTGNNRASAAEMLGLSRQSLYVKLRRFGMASEPEAHHSL
ncbi:MAG: transcriptional regulator PpsR [Rhodoferax sp.]|nr:transcriptional regulator PpsR [Rhodoferax sp.]